MNAASARRILRNAFLHVTPYDADAAAVLSGAMDRVDNTRSHELRRARASRIAVACLECGKKFSVSPKNVCPECPKCGGCDVDVA